MENQAVKSERKPATVKPGWEMPAAEPCDDCGSDTIPAYYNDYSEVWLHFWCTGCCGMELYRPIDWPFVEEHALFSELEALGFRDCEDLAEVPHG